MEDPTKRNLPIKRETAQIERQLHEEQKKESVDGFTQALIATAGTLELTEHEMKVLYEQIDPEAIEIRPDGVIYMPASEYRRILIRAFGLSWAMVEDGKPFFKDNRVYWGFRLVIRKVYCGYAIGDQEYMADNPQMSYGDAMEGAKSNAFTRLAKGIGIGLELWNPAFIRKWRKEHAEQYEYINKRGEKKVGWRRKDDTFAGPPPEPELPTPAPVPVRPPAPVVPPAGPPPAPSARKLPTGDKGPSRTCGGANPKLKGKDVSLNFCERCFFKGKCDLYGMEEAEQPPLPTEESPADLKPPDPSDRREEFFRKIQKEMGRIGMSVTFNAMAQLGFEYASDVPPEKEGDVLAHLAEYPDNDSDED